MIIFGKNFNLSSPFTPFHQALHCIRVHCGLLAVESVVNGTSSEPNSSDLADFFKT